MTSTKKLTMAGMFAALTALLTMFPHFKIPFSQGYIHLGDSLIYTAAILYGGIFGAATAGIGSAIADLIVFPTYALPTLIIKGLMGLTVGKISDNSGGVSSRNIVAMMVGGLIMMVGYGFYEILMVPNEEVWYAVMFNTIIFNFIQYAAGILIGILILTTLKKANILKR